METIPEGDWYCYECKNKASGERNCIVCGKRPVKNFVLCDHCPRAYHADCLNPPLLKVNILANNFSFFFFLIYFNFCKKIFLQIPRSKWNCVTCAIKFPKKKCGRKLGWRKNKDMKAKEKEDHRDQSNRYAELS